MKIRVIAVLLLTIVGLSQRLAATVLGDQTTQEQPTNTVTGQLPATETQETTAASTSNQPENKVVTQAREAPKPSKQQTTDKKGPSGTKPLRTASAPATSTATTTTVSQNKSITPPADRFASARASSSGSHQGEPRPAQHVWLLPLLAACTLFSLAAAAIVAFPLLRPKPESDATRRLNNLALNLAGSLQQVEEKLQNASKTVADKLQAANILTTDHLSPVSAEIDKLRLEITRVGQAIEEVATQPSGTPPSADRTAGNQVALEHDILGEHWKQFRGNKELSASFDSAVQDTTWEQLVDELARYVPADLKATFDSVMAPWREHRTFVGKLGLVPRLIKGEIPRKKTDAEEVWRTREFSTLLTVAQSLEGAQHLNFRFKSWVTETFLPFADVYLQRYQQAQLDRRASDLQPGVGLVRRLLALAAVEPIDVTPGETSFDSTRHIGRSTSNDPHFPDGVITGVVRNGFIEGGQQVIRQPEVIVNRLR